MASPQMTTDPKTVLRLERLLEENEQAQARAKKLQHVHIEELFRLREARKTLLVLMAQYRDASTYELPEADLG